MLFNSIEYLFFLPIVVIIFYNIPQKVRVIFLLVCSWFFYACWRIEYIWLLLISTCIDYFAGISISKNQHNLRYKKIFLSLSLVTNLGILFFFKYYNFFVNEISRNIGTSTLSTLDILLPVGISFYTFQSMGYTIDVYREKIKPEKSFFIFALYVSYFPQLVAGPIETASRLIPQLKKKINLNSKNIEIGLKLIMRGLFKKIVIADNLSLIVDSAYLNVSSTPPEVFLLASVAFTYQVFCDFSGYCDIAVGSSKLFGIDIMNNFVQPFLSRDLGSFWRRTHASLTIWFREYVYIPLGGSRSGTFKKYLNIFIVFVLSGIWHGSNWTFVAWGSLNGAYFFFGYLSRDIGRKTLSLLKIKDTSLIYGIYCWFKLFFLYTFSLILFRASSISEALQVYGKIFKSFCFENTQYFQIINQWISSQYKVQKYIIIFVFVIILEIYHCFIDTNKFNKIMALERKKPLFFFISDSLLIYFLLMFIFLFGNFNRSPFLYFQF